MKPTKITAEAIADLLILQAMWEIINERAAKERKPKSLYSDAKKRFVDESGKPYRWPAYSYKLPKNDDGINVLNRIMHQLAMPS